MKRSMMHPSTMTLGRVILRFLGSMFGALRDHLTADPGREQFAFLLALPVVTEAGPLLLVQDLFLPEASDLVVHSAGGVEPTRDFQALVYVVAEQKRLAIIDVHTHLTDGAPCFSRVDCRVARRNGRYIARRFLLPTTFGIVVFNRDATAYAGLVFDRGRGAFVPITQLQLIGPGLEIHDLSTAGAATAANERYARQQLIPGWNQAALVNLRIGIVGLGGHGAQLLQTLVSIGAGSAGWIAGVDPDVIEPSNLPRLPYAAPADVGKPKLEVAAEFVRRKNPAAAFHALPCSVTDPSAIARLRACDVLFGCGDNDGVRQVLNDLSVRCGIPLIDLGADIRVAGDVVEAGGQVRVTVPGTTACLACCGGFDPGQAAIDLLGDADRELYRQRGYVIGAVAPATPSVAALNALVAAHAVTVLLALVHGEPFRRFEYLHADWLAGTTLVARASRRLDCPACGQAGFLFCGVPEVVSSMKSEPSWQLVDAQPECSALRPTAAGSRKEKARVPHSRN